MNTKALETNLTEGLRLAFDKFRKQAEENHAADRTALLSTIEAKLREAVFAGELSANDARACLTEVKDISAEASKAFGDFTKAAETLMRDNDKTVSGWFNLAEEKMLERIEERVTGLFALSDATARTAEAVRDGRATEAQLLVSTAIRDLETKATATFDRIRDAADRFINDGESTSRAIATLLETGEAHIEGLQAVEATAREANAAALIEYRSFADEALETFSDQAREAVDAWKLEAAGIAETFNTFLAMRMDDAISGLEDKATATATETQIALADEARANLVGIEARFEVLQGETIDAIRSAMEAMNTEHGESIRAAQAIIENSLTEISASVETHVTAMLDAAVDKALNASPRDFRGERGEPGEPGEPGPPGPRGERGLDGTSIGFVGIWNDGLEYRPGDVVMENGSTWLAKRKTHGEQPTKLGGTDNPPWTLVAMRGAKGERGLRGDRGERGMPGPVAPAIIEMAFVDDQLALVLEDGTLIKAKFDETLIKRIAAFAAKIVKGEADGT